ncbi:MAG: hypothetical protein IJK77_08070 [Lachnospiraceae bacterium]|nr:hypothetical protein [Lachnospiraceae bacterium]
MTKKKRLRAVLIAITIITAVITYDQTAKAYAILSYWDSTGNSVAFWSFSPAYSRTTFGNDAAFASQFQQALTYAVNQWSSVTCSITYNSSPNVSIPVFGGTRPEILDGTGYTVLPNEAGVTVGASIFYTYASYNGSLKTVKKQVNQQKVYIVNSNGTFNYYKHLCLHEMGHAMGWLDHSTTVSAVMYGNVNTYTLTPNEKNHLHQIYDTYVY